MGPSWCGADGRSRRLLHRCSSRSSNFHTVRDQTPEAPAATRRPQRLAEQVLGFIHLLGVCDQPRHPMATQGARHSSQPPIWPGLDPVDARVVGIRPPGYPTSRASRASELRERQRPRRASPVALTGPVTVERRPRDTGVHRLGRPRALPATTTTLPNGTEFGVTIRGSTPRKLREPPVTSTLTGCKHYSQSWRAPLEVLDWRKGKTITVDGFSTLA